MNTKTLMALAVAAVLAAPLAEARITRIEIDAARSQSPTFGGFSWPNVGQYEKIAGKAFGEVDPHDRQNRVIVDIEFAPRNARGNVEYAFNFYILKPIDLSKGARRMMYEPPNRGGKTWAALGRITVDAGANSDDPGSAITNPTVLANSFLMPRGYTIAWSGWEDLDTVDNATFNAAGTAINLVGSSFIANDIYEFAYTAKDPKVNGLGFAAVRDWMEFLRYEKRDDQNNPDPLAGHIKRVYTEIPSQPGLKTTRYHFDYGLDFYETGIATIHPPATVRRRSRPVGAVGPSRRDRGPQRRAAGRETAGEMHSEREQRRRRLRDEARKRE